MKRVLALSEQADQPVETALAPWNLQHGLWYQAKTTQSRNKS
jgi:hypothetical protein